MIKHLTKIKKYQVTEVEKGIYYVNGDLIPIQILVTKNLSGEENLWLKSLTNKLKATETAEKLVENYMDHKDSRLHRSVIETIMRANQKIFREVNGMSDIFMEIVQEKFDRKLKEEVEKATEENTVKTKLTERISLIQKKCAKNKPLSVIADELETDTDEILSLYDIISKNPDKTTDEIYQMVAD